METNRIAAAELRPAKSCAAIHDISGVGKCSLTIALPVLSVCGVETSVLPTAVLSTHTGGFTGVHSRDLTDDMLPMARHWKAEGCRFSALYTGYLGSAAQLDVVEEIFDLFAAPDTLIFVDPVMGDNGRLYSACTEELADGMVRLCRRADVIAPNLTEACRILQRPYVNGPCTPSLAEELLTELCKLGPKTAVLTGIAPNDRSIGAACRSRAAGKTSFFLLPRIEGVYHGTGDLFSSTLLGGLLNGMTPEEACALAVEFTHRVIADTHAQSVDHRFGPKFEHRLPWLGQQIEARLSLRKDYAD